MILTFVADDYHTKTVANMLFYTLSQYFELIEKLPESNRWIYLDLRQEGNLALIKVYLPKSCVYNINEKKTPESKQVHKSLNQLSSMYMGTLKEHINELDEYCLVSVIPVDEHEKVV